MGSMDLYVVNLPKDTDEVTITKGTGKDIESIIVYNYDGTEYLAQATTNDDKTVTAKTRLASKYVQGEDGKYTQQILNEGTTGNYLSVQYPYTYDASGNWTGGGDNICAIKLVLSSETLDEESVEKVKGTLYGQSANEELKFYTYNYYDYSMLGNNWYKGNTLKSEVGQTGSDLINTYYKYLNASTSVPTGWDADDMSKITLKWYYGTTYSATGEGYQSVTINGASTGKDSDGVNIYKNQSGFEYSNEFVTPSTENQPAYYWFTLVPETVKAGSYYYYVDISYADDSGTVQQISSKNCQAWVTVKEASKGSSSSSDITVNFSLNGFDGMASIAKKSVTVASGSTVGTVFEKVLSDAGYKYEYKGNNYIASITDKYNYTLGEFDRGSGSGWMYLVNDKAPTVGLKSYKLSDGDDIVWYYTGDYTKDKYAKSSMSTTDTQSVTTDANSDATSATADVKVTEQTAADGTKEKVATVTVSSSNQKEILKQAKASKSKEIVLNASSSTAKDASKVDVNLDKSFVNSIVSDTDAKLTVKTPLGDKTYTQDELKTLAASATGSTITLTIEKTDATADTTDELDAKAEVAKLTPVARSAKTAKKSIKVTTSLDKDDKAIIAELKDAGYTIKYRFYRSTKKSASYKPTLTKSTTTYLNTAGKAGTRYYYKVQIRVYDKDGKLVAKTALKQCKYATRVFG